MELYPCGCLNNNAGKTLDIRLLVTEEYEAARLLVWKVFSVYEAPVYGSEGTEEFRRCLNDEKYLNGIVWYGAYYGNILTGVLAFRKENMHICFFFVDGKYQRRGIGTELFKRMVCDYPGRTLTLNSSPYGVPFYKSIGFTPSGMEQTVNGITFLPMVLSAEMSEPVPVILRERRDLKERASKWFSSKWKVPESVYRDSIEASFSSFVPSWYLCLDGSRIVSGMGVIENDFHCRKDLTPNVCAVFTEPEYRCRGIAGKLLNFVCDDMSAHGINTLYLLTDHTGFYERYGWEFLCNVMGDGEDYDSRMYIHKK